MAGFDGQAMLDLGAPYLFHSIAAVVIGGVYILGGRGSYLAAAGAVRPSALVSVLLAMNMPDHGRSIIYGVVILALLLAYGKVEGRVSEVVRNQDYVLTARKRARWVGGEAPSLYKGLSKKSPGPNCNEARGGGDRPTAAGPTGGGTPGFGFGRRTWSDPTRIAIEVGLDTGAWPPPAGTPVHPG